MKFASPLKSVYFYLTEGCNLACRHCWIDPPFESEELKHAFLPLEQFRRVLSEAKPLGLEAVKLTGGEPFLHPQITDILREIRDQGLRLIIETNGTLVTDEIASLVAEIEHHFVSISIDSFDPAAHDRIRNVKGAFKNAMSGFDLFIRHGINPQIIASLLPENKDNLKELIQFAEDRGANSFKLNIIQPASRGETLMKQGKVVQIDEVIRIANQLHAEKRTSERMPVFVSIPFAFRPLSLIASGDIGCCGIKSIIGVLATGEYALCGIGMNTPELIFGKIGQDSLETIWNDNQVLKTIQTDIPDKLEGICGDCLMRRICLGSCLAQNYYSTRNLLASFWFCEAAAAKGLFPESRMHPRRRKTPEPAKS
jgi:SynChlorMet cassette radical SAM/SPASM protein ScmF